MKELQDQTKNCGYTIVSVTLQILLRVSTYT